MGSNQQGFKGPSDAKNKGNHNSVEEVKNDNKEFSICWQKLFRRLRSDLSKDSWDKNIAQRIRIRFEGIQCKMLEAIIESAKDMQEKADQEVIGNNTIQNKGNKITANSLSSSPQAPNIKSGQTPVLEEGEELEAKEPADTAEDDTISSSLIQSSAAASAEEENDFDEIVKDDTKADATLSKPYATPPHENYRVFGQLDGRKLRVKRLAETFLPGVGVVRQFIRQFNISGAREELQRNAAIALGNDECTHRLLTIAFSTMCDVLDIPELIILLQSFEGTINISSSNEQDIVHSTYSDPSILLPARAVSIVHREVNDTLLEMVDAIELQIWTFSY